MADARSKLEKLLPILKTKLLETHKVPGGKYVFENFTIPADRSTEYYFEDFGFVYEDLEEFLKKGSISTLSPIVNQFNKSHELKMLKPIFEQPNRDFFYGREKELSELFLELVDLCDEAIRLYRKIIQEESIK